MDFLIYYETVQREYENACLIKSELERRGYSVKLCATIYTDYWKSFFYKPKVNIVHGFYGESPGHITKLKKKVTTKVVNLQYEQLVELGEDGLPVQMPKEDCKRAYHICWGEAGANNLRKCGVEENHIIECGPIQFDLVREEFSKYFYSKEELGRQFGIDSQKKWILFISDFAYTSYNGQIIDKNIRKAEVLNYEAKANKLIMGFIKQFLGKHSDIIYIYRPHPSENIKSEMYELEKEYDNFRCIRELSIKQWIHVVDKLNTWNSTAIAEAYVCKKNCMVIDIDESEMTEDCWNYKIDIIGKSKAIHTYSEFEKENLNYCNFEPKQFPMDFKQFEAYYGTAWKNEPVYLQLCDFLERVYRNDSYTEKFSNRKYKEIRMIMIKAFFYSLRGNIRLYTFPIINRIFPSKCKPDERHVLYAPQKLKNIRNRINKYVLELSPKYRISE